MSTENFAEGLYREPRHGVIKGVCAGIARQFGIDKLWVRLACVIGAFNFPLVFILGYWVAAVLLPKRPVF